VALTRKKYEVGSFGISDVINALKFSLDEVTEVEKNKKN
jgi:hypothetical protein